MVAVMVNGETLKATEFGYPVAWCVTDGPDDETFAGYYLCAECVGDIAWRADEAGETVYLHSMPLMERRSAGHVCDRCLQYLPAGEPYCCDCGSDSAPVRSVDGDSAYCRACAVRAGLLTLAGAIAANDADTDYVNARWARGESVRDLLDALDRERWDLLDLADEGAE